jgi:lipase chaperone LimK
MKIFKNKRFKIIVMGVAVVALFIIGYILYPKDSKQSEYIFYKNHPAALADFKAALAAPSIENHDADNVTPDDTNENPQMDDQNIKSQELVSGGKLIYSRTTLEYFKNLEHLFKSAPDIDDHFEKVRAYLLDHFSPADAQLLFDTYQKYLQCEMDLAKELVSLSKVKTPEEAIALLNQIQASWRAQVGADLADMICGADVKATEYTLKRAEIVKNNALDGDEKERMIQQLNQDTWGTEAQTVENQPPPFSRYQEKLEIYQKDLDEMSPEDRQAKIQEFRAEFFPPDVVQKLNDIDNQAVTEKATEAQYHEQEKAIAENPDLTDDEKKQQITDLQNKTFGDQADEFRRREAIEKGAEELSKKPETKRNQTGTSGE